MDNLQIVKSEAFGEIVCDFYRNGNDDVFMTRSQIGQALEYSDPGDAVRKIHERRKERLDKFSVPVKLSGTDGKFYDTILYNERGIYEICRYSHQPKADSFYDFVYDVMESVRRKGCYIINHCQQIPEKTGEVARFLTVVGRYMEKQGSPAFEIMEMVVSVSAQHHIYLPQNVVKTNPLQLSLWEDRK